MLRALVVTVAAGVLLATSSAAALAAPAACAPADGPHDYQAGLAPLIRTGEGGGAEGASREAVGPQFTMLWLDDVRQGWDVGLAPGAMNADQARAAIVDQLSARFSAEQVSYLADRLHVEPQPYSEADLQATSDQVVAQMQAADLGAAWSAGYGLCTLSDAIRVEVLMYGDSTQATQDRVRAILAPYGDRVRFAVSASAPPSGGTGRVAAAPPRVADYLSVASTRRCVRRPAIRLRARPSRRAQIDAVTVTVTAGGRSVTRGTSALVRPLVVRLRAAHTTVTVAVRLRDGRRAARAYAFSRCG
jgi:hypothetical protein